MDLTCHDPNLSPPPGSVWWECAECGAYAWLWPGEEPPECCCDDDDLDGEILS